MRAWYGWRSVLSVLPNITGSGYVAAVLHALDATKFIPTLRLEAG